MNGGGLKILATGLLLGVAQQRLGRFQDTVSLKNYSLGMKSITIRIEDEFYRQAHIKAAETSTSILALFSKFPIDSLSGNLLKPGLNGLCGKSSKSGRNSVFGGSA
jgi:hypothetical protein